MKVNKIIKLSTLIEKRACRKQVDLFRQLFGEQVELTAELAVKYANRFNASWCADNLLTPAAWKAYKEATAPTLKAYKEATATTLKVYNEAKAIVLKAYSEVNKATALKAYSEATATAWKAYDEAKGTAFFNLYDGDMLQ